jgi:SAM-dependent methyltransferase
MGARLAGRVSEKRVNDLTDSVALSSFRHRRDYSDDAGRDRWTVRAVNAWVTSVLPPLLQAAARSGAVLDVGCAEQPFRSLLELHGQRYVGMDVVQNRTESVDIVCSLEDVPSPAEPFGVVLCTEVLEHVTDIEAAFAGLRRVTAIGGVVVATVPFVFPLHMEPYDYRRLTLHGMERLAADHGFVVERSERLGTLPHVLTTLLADASILPESRSVFAKAKVAALRVFFAALVRVFDSPSLSRGIAVNSNFYLSNGVVLRAI